MAKVTAFGVAALAAAATTSSKIDCVNMLIGDGNGAVPVFTGAETALVRQVDSVQVNAVYRNTANPNYIYIDAVIPYNKGGYWIREAAVTDSAGNVLIIGEFAPLEKPAANSSQAREVTVRLIALIENNIGAVNLFNFGNSGGSLITGGYPVGSVVENYLAANDSAAIDWVRLADNVSADLTIYPKLAGLNSQGSIKFSSVAANNLSALIAGVAGTWTIVRWRILNGIHVVLVTGSSVAYYRCFTSLDGVTFIERGNLTAATNVSGAQVNLYFLNGKYYACSNYGIWESADLVTWARKTTTYYYSMGYAFGLYLIGDSSGRIYTTTDFVTFTLRFTASGSPVMINFEFLNGRVICAMFTAATQVKYAHTTDGISWTEATISVYTDSQNISYNHVRVLNGKFYLIGDTRDFTLESADGVSGWVVCPTVMAGSAGYDLASVVALDTLYCRSQFSTDMRSPPRVTTAGNNPLCFDGVYVWAGNFSSTSLTLTRVPAVLNANRVYLPNVANRMMKVK